MSKTGHEHSGGDPGEARRLAELDRYRVMDTAPEPPFDALVRTAALVAGSSAALVGLIDEDRQWFKAQVGMSAAQTARRDTVCDHVVRSRRELIVEDLSVDARFAHLPAITGEDHLRFYAGFPLLTPGGEVLGTLCVLDHVPGELDDAETTILRTLAEQVMAQLELRRQIAEGQDANRRLAASEARFRFLVEHSMDAIARHRPDGSVIDASPAVRELLGLDPEDSANWDFGPLVHPEDLDAYGRGFALALQGQETTVTGRMKHADGRYRHLETSMRPILDENGDLQELIATTRDASERVGAAQALAAAHRAVEEHSQMLEEAQELAEVGSWWVDLGTQALHWSAQMYRIFGMDARSGEQLTLERYLGFINPADRDAMSAILEEVVATGTPRDLEHRIVRADGQERVLLGRARLDHDADGRPLRVGGSAQDVTEMRRREKEITAARDRFVQLLGAATEQAIIGTDLDGLVNLFNKGAERMTGWTADEAIGQSPWALLTDRDELARRGAELTSGTTGMQEWTWVRKDGERITAQITITPMRDENGEVSGNLGIATDVTEQRRTERERDDAMADISRARDEALAANVAKSAFLATMSHEIRTPMNAVIGMTGLILDTPLADDQRELLETVRSSGDQLLAIINDILDFSKVESGDLDLELRPFALHDLVEGTVAQFAGSAKGLELVADVDPACPPQVVGDVTRLRQVLSNLLGNAVKFTREGDVLVQVQAEPAADGTVRLRFDVRDTGIGIPPESLHRLFKSFSQVDASTTRTYGGTGLGLAISKALVTAMGGEVWVDSTPGQGSTFSFHLSLLVAPAGPPVVGPDLAGRSVLVVDDNATVRRVVRRQLESRGMTVREAETAFGALELLDRQTFDVAVLDLGLPGTDGEQLAMAIRRRRLSARLPLVLLSGIGRRSDDDLFDVVLTKPVRSQTLAEGVARALAPAGSLPVVPAQRTPAPPAAPARPLRILLAEDNEVNQRVGSLMLGKLGHTVEIAPNGVEALAAAHAGDYDVILMDMHMPVMDGLEATRRILAELPAERRPPIIAMTASVTLEDREACTAAGMDGYLAKPVRAAELHAALAELPSRGVPTA